MGWERGRKVKPRLVGFVWVFVSVERFLGVGISVFYLHEAGNRVWKRVLSLMGALLIALFRASFVLSTCNAISEC